MTTVTVGLDDPGLDGLVPREGALVHFRLSRARENGDRYITSEKWTMIIAADGTGTTEVPDYVTGVGVLIDSSASGLGAQVAVAGYPSGTISLVALINGYQVDPSTLQPLPAGSTALELIDGVRATANAATQTATDAHTVATGAATTAGTAATDAAAAKSAADGVAGVVNDGRLSETQLNTTFVAAEAVPGIASASPRGIIIVYDGDSVTAGNSGGVVDPNGNSYPCFAGLFLNGRMKYQGNVAVPGSKIEAMVARFDTTVAPLAPGVVVLIAGTNNVSNADPVSFYLTNLDAYLAKVKGIGARLVMGELPSRAESTARRQLTLTYNVALRDWAALNGVTLIPNYALLVDPATGDYKTGLGNTDQTHPTSAGNVLMGKLCADILTAELPAGGFYLPQENADPNNLIVNGLMLGAVTQPTDPTKLVPSGWAVTTSVHKTGITPTVTTDADFIGKVYRLDFTSAYTGSERITQDVEVNTAIIPGHKYAFRGKLKATGLRGSNTHVGDGKVLTVVMLFNRTDSTATRVRALSTTEQDIALGVFNAEMVAPAGATQLQVQFFLSATGTAGAGALVMGQCAVLDLTAMGLA